MVTKIKKALNAVWQAFELEDFGLGFFCGFLLMFSLFVNGCFQKAPSKPDRLTLAPGQSAVTLETTTVLARIPAQGNVLYEGPVVIERGTVVIKPVVE